MNVGSLFSGIGGLDLGLGRAGMRVIWQCESDPYARAVLRKHWPDIPCHGDVREVGARNLVPVDLICGGFPCQDISAAGLGRGLAGERSGLWFHFARILGEVRPPWALIESTPPFRRWVPVVRRHLRSIGYASLPLQLRAADAGAPHLRKRIYVLAYAYGDPWKPRRPGNCEQGRLGADVADPSSLTEREQADEAKPVTTRRPARDVSRGGGQDVGDTDRVRKLQPQGLIPDEWGRPSDAGWWNAEPDVGRVADGVPSRVDRLRCLGNAVVPQVAEYIGRLILAHAEGA